MPGTVILMLNVKSNLCNHIPKERIKDIQDLVLDIKIVIL